MRSRLQCWVCIHHPSCGRGNRQCGACVGCPDGTFGEFCECNTDGVERQKSKVIFEQIPTVRKGQKDDRAGNIPVKHIDRSPLTMLSLKKVFQLINFNASMMEVTARVFLTAIITKTMQSMLTTDCFLDLNSPSSSPLASGMAHLLGLQLHQQMIPCSVESHGIPLSQHTWLKICMAGT